MHTFCFASPLVPMQLPENVLVTDRAADVSLNGSQQFCCPAERVTSVSSASIVHAAESLTVSDRMDYCEVVPRSPWPHRL